MTIASLLAGMCHLGPNIRYFRLIRDDRRGLAAKNRVHEATDGAAGVQEAAPGPGKVARTKPTRRLGVCRRDCAGPSAAAGAGIRVPWRRGRGRAASQAHRDARSPSAARLRAEGNAPELP